MRIRIFVFLYFLNIFALSAQDQFLKAWIDVEYGIDQYKIEAKFISKLQNERIFNYKLITEKSGTNTSSNTQSGKFTATPDKEILLSNTQINSTSQDYFKALLQIYFNNNLIAQDSIEFGNKPEPRAETEVASKPESKSKSKSKSKTVTKVTPGPKSKPKSKTVTKVTPRLEPKPIVKTKTETKITSRVESKSKSKSNLKSKSKLKPTPSPTPSPSPSPQSKPKTITKFTPKVESKPKLTSAPKSTPKIEPTPRPTPTPTPTPTPKPKKEVPSFSDNLEIDGLIIDETRSKVARDFYDFFYSKWIAPQDANDFVIKIKELPSRGRVARVTVEVNDKALLTRVLQPRLDVVEDTAKLAIRVVRKHLSENESLKKDLDESDIKGSGIF